MTELKADSQSTRVQGQSSAKTRRTSRLADQPVSPEGSESVASEPEVAPKRKRQLNTKTPAKTKRQAATKSKQTISTQVKPIWDVSRSTIASRFAQLEQELQHISQQSASIVEEMEALRAIAQDVDASDRKASGLELPVYSAKSDSAKSEESAQPSSPAASESLPELQMPELQMPEVMQARTASSPIPAFSASSRRPSRRSRRHTLKSVALQVWQRATHLPSKPSAIALDALLWILASIGLRYGLSAIASSLPALALPISMLVFVPALMAIYAALFLPQVNSVSVYRLLLITVGLLIGGKFL
ncbi:MAG: hypothetical protein KME43_08505 [Myxacorys chilensis ATA2-1-KO14]|jgi:hypothetical protein|nr:hypothetical protein [Myxacorys chilensis ATA2-1-KO14]